MLLTVLAYMGVVAGWNVLRMGSVAPLLSQWTFLLGIPIGVLFVWIDVAVEAYLSPDSQMGQLLRKAFQNRGSGVDHVGRMLRAIRSVAGQNVHLCSQNVLFAGLWVVMALFGLTSTSSALGKGVVLGIGLQLSVRLLGSLRRFNQVLGTRDKQPLFWFFWPVRQNFSSQQQRVLAGGFLAVFALFTLLA